ncbi:FAD-dependent oxidoreductase [Kitasatospora sp. NPDC048540]|uniref:phytoene desaturase family protein n=1 Tax=unclassified Kitasatospora TaxID=2633591 RepID=UPI00053ADD93|nr:FAD-dependent oxidoreductase [Kitasatospora sp. MBT63]
MARIVIIGAGMSGLAAAARLATLGHRVTVCEDSGTYGGQAGRHELDGFRFDTGPTLLTLPAVYRDLALKTGKEPLEQLVALAPVDPESRHLFPDGTDLLLPNASRGGVGQALDAAFGAGSGAAWAEVMNRGRAVWEATRRPLLEEPLPDDTTPLRADPYPAAPRRGLARLRRRPGATLAEVARHELGGHPGLAQLLHEYALRFGLDPREAPAGATVLPYMEQSFGVWYVEGGIRALAGAVYRRCELRGVEFRFGTPVTEVLTDGGRVSGVLADGKPLDADLVVAAGGHDRLVPGRSARPVPSAGARLLTVFLALDGARPAGTPHRTVVHAADPAREWDEVFGAGALPERPTVQVLRPDDASLVPAGGHEAVTLTVTVPEQGEPGPAELESYTDGLLAHLAAAGLDLRGRVRRRETRISGPMPPPALAGAGGAYLGAPNRSAVPGLYLVGADAHPGGGLARVGMSASITAGLIGPA